MGMSRGLYRPKPKTKVIDFTGTEYDGLEVTVSLSIPYGALEDIKAGQEDQIKEIMNYMLVDWNLCDIKTGDPLGDPSPETIRKVPMDILMAIFNRAMEEIGSGGISKNAELLSGNN
jgi:hypothetical protein